MVEHAGRDGRERLDILRQRRAEDFGDGQAVGAELQEAGLLHVVEDARVLEVGSADGQAFLPAAAENGRIGEMGFRLFFCHGHGGFLLAWFLFLNESCG